MNLIKIPETEHVVVVEDDSDAREALVELLEFHGFRVTSCANPYEALAALTARPDAILITDFVLPGMDGIALAGEAVLRHPGCRILILSGHERSRDWQSADWQWLRKPVAFEELLRAIRRAARPSTT